MDELNKTLIQPAPQQALMAWSPNWQFSAPRRISNLGRAWAATAVGLGLFTFFYLLFNIPLNLAFGNGVGARMDLLEAFAALWFVAGGTMVLRGSRTGLRVLMAVTAAASLMNFADLVRDLSPSNAMLQLVATMYCLALGLIVRNEEHS